MHTLHNKLQALHFLPLLVTSTACNGHTWTNTYDMKGNTPITTPTVAHMATQIRVKQLGTQTSQNKRLAAIQT